VRVQNTAVAIGGFIIAGDVPNNRVIGPSRGCGCDDVCLLVLEL
jgi:hypothetical protein